MTHVEERQQDWQIACTVEDLDGEEMLECRVGDRIILVVRFGNRFVACPALCPHMDEPLAHGFVDGKVLTCTKHLWQWDLDSGAPIGPAEQSLNIAPVRIDGGSVLVDVAAFDNQCKGGACT